MTISGIVAVLEHVEKYRSSINHDFLNTNEKKGKTDWRYKTYGTRTITTRINNKEYNTNYDL